MDNNNCCLSHEVFYLFIYLIVRDNLTALTFIEVIKLPSVKIYFKGFFRMVIYMQKLKVSRLYNKHFFRPNNVCNYRNTFLRFDIILMSLHL